MPFINSVARITSWRLWRVPFTLFLICLFITQTATSQSIDRDRERGRILLKAIKDDIRKYYYDATFHGIDLDKRFAAADEKMKTAESLGQVFGIIAQVLMDFDDSHLFFNPPRRVTRYDFGLQVEMVGDECLVKAVRPESDAQVKGLKPGDRVLSFGGYPPNRQIMWKIIYAYYILRPQPTLTFVIQSPGGQPRDVTIAAAMKTVPDSLASNSLDRDYRIRELQNLQYLYRARTVELDKNVIVCKMPTFEMSEGGVDDLMRKLRKYDTIILDLRGNGGGYVATLQRLVGYFFDHEIKIADLKGRKNLKPEMASWPGADRIFKGKLIVLVDSESASSSEMFARVIQLEKRGVVIGDHTMGAVMRAIGYFQVDADVAYAVSITDADVYMSDAKSLEKVGVTPDETVLPTQEDLAAQRDPVLSRAAAIAGVTLDAAKAGSFFPIEWRKQ